ATSRTGACPLISSRARERLVADYVVPAEGDGRIIADGAVDIGTDGRIVAVGPADELGPGPETRTVGGLLMPGLVNAHAHTPMTLVRSVGDGLPLQRWLSEGVWPLEARLTPDDARWAMMLGSVEMLLAGVTTSCEMYLFEDALVDAVLETGARLVLTPGVIAALAPDGDVGPRVDQITRCHEQHHGREGRITVGFAPHSLYDLPPELVSEIAERARSLDALFHIHLEETSAERAQVLEAHGRSATRILADLGVLEGPVLAAHGVWLDDDDRQLLGRSGAAVAHCPQSNLKLGSGIAPVPELLAAGVQVGIGTDGPASNDDLDLWEELRLAPLLARGHRTDPQAMTTATALDLATRQSARSIHLDDVGELRPGAQADIIRLDLDTPAFTPLRPETMLTQLVFAGSARMVTDVWVAGRQVVAGGEVTLVDRGRIMEECQRRADRLREQ
ncbi:MAG: amidohydrolase, partial [Actinomycetota bacterium]